MLAVNQDLLQRGRLEVKPAGIGDIMGIERQAFAFLRRAIHRFQELPHNFFFPGIPDTVNTFSGQTATVSHFAKGRKEDIHLRISFTLLGRCTCTQMPKRLQERLVGGFIVVAAGIGERYRLIARSLHMHTPKYSP